MKKSGHPRSAKRVVLHRAKPPGTKASVAPDTHGKLTFNDAMIYVKDVERGVRFYRDLLGFKLIEELRFDGTPVSSRMRAPRRPIAPGEQIHLHSLWLWYKNSLTSLGLKPQSGHYGLGFTGAEAANPSSQKESGIRIHSDGTRSGGQAQDLRGELVQDVLRKRHRREAPGHLPRIYCNLRCIP